MGVKGFGPRHRLRNAGDAASAPGPERTRLTSRVVGRGDQLTVVLVMRVRGDGDRSAQCERMLVVRAESTTSHAV
jgi:hypothetical protein